MRVFPSSMATSSTSGYAACHVPSAPQSIVTPARCPTRPTISAMRGPLDHRRDRTFEMVGRADGTLRRQPKRRLAFLPVAWFGHVDAKGLPEAPPPQRGDDHGVAALHPFHPAEIEVALGDRGPDRTRDVWASLGPIEAQSAQVAEGRTRGGKLDPQPGEKTGARCREFCRRRI